MRTDTMQPLRALQTLRPLGGTRADLRAPDDAGQFEAALDGSKTADRGGIVVAISEEATALFERQGRTSGAPDAGAGGPRPMIEDPFEAALDPEIFGDEEDETVGPASRLGLSPSADLGDSDVERYGAAEDFGKEGVFQVYGVEGADDADPDEAANDAGPKGPGAELSADERKMVAELRARDAEVRAHEAAHMAAGGGLTGGASFTYQVGPDGGRYAIGGEVSIDASPGNTPQETVMKAQRIRAAALAPADPSAQDRAVAAAAARMEAAARGDLAQERATELQRTFEETATVEDEAVEVDGDKIEVPPPNPYEFELVGAERFEEDDGAEIIGFPGQGAAFDSESSPRGEDVDLMEIYERVTGRASGKAEAEPDDTAARRGGRLSGVEGGTAQDAQLSGMNTSLEDAWRAITDPQAAAWDLVA